MKYLTRIFALVIFMGASLAMVYGQAVADPASTQHVKKGDTFSGTTGVTGANNGVVPDDGTVAAGRVFLDTGLWEFSTPLGITGQLNVDAANTGDPLEDGSVQHPFDLISEAFTASSANNLIKIAGGSYAEALVVPHDLHIDGPAVTGLVSVSILSGDLFGQLDKIRYHSGGGIIFPTSDATTNGDCFTFLWEVAGTTPGAFEITLLASGTDYDVGTGGGSSRYVIRGNVNKENTSISGIGAMQPHIITSDIILFLNAVDNDFTNVELTSANSVIENNAGHVTNMNLTHVKANGSLTVSSLSGGSTGNFLSVEVSVAFNMGGSGSNAGIIEDLVVGDNTTLNEFSGYAHIQETLRLLITNTMSGTVVIDSGDVRLGGEWTGTVKGSRAPSSLFSTALAFTINLSDSIFSGGAGGSTFFNGIVKAASSFINVRSNILFGAGYIIEDGVLYERCAHTSLDNQTSAVENKGTFIFNRFISDGVSDDRTGLSVSDGAEIFHSTFEGYDGINAIRGRELLSDSVNGNGFGSPTLFAKYFEGANTLVFPLSAEPRKGDGAGGTTGMDTDVFDARVIEIDDQASPGAGEDLSNLNGFVFEFEVFKDTGNIYGYGVDVFVVRSTVADATAIDDLISNPASDLTANALISYMGQAATIELDDNVMGGGLIAPEVAVTAPSGLTVGAIVKVDPTAPTGFSDSPLLVTGLDVDSSGAIKAAGAACAPAGSFLNKCGGYSVPTMCTDGNGIYDGSCSLTGATVITMGSNALTFNAATGCDTDFVVDLSGATTGEISFTGGDCSSWVLGNSLTATTAGTSDITFNAGTVCGNGDVVINSANWGVTACGVISGNGSCLTSVPETDPVYIADPAFSITSCHLTILGNTSNTNSGDQTITLTGDVTGSGTGSFAATIATGAVGPTELASTAVTPAAYTNADITVDADGRITAAANGSGSNIYSPQDLRERYLVPYEFTGSIDELATTISGTGSTSTRANRRSLRVDGSSTGQGHAWASWNIDSNQHPTGLQPTVTTENIIDWDEDMAIHARFTVFGATTTTSRVIGWLGLRQDDIIATDPLNDSDALNSAGAGTGEAIGFEVRDLNLFLVSWDGATFNEVDTSYDLIIGEMNFVTLEKLGTTMKLWHSTDGVTYTDRGTISANLPSGDGESLHQTFVFGVSDTGAGTDPDMVGSFNAFNLYFK